MNIVVLHGQDRKGSTYHITDYITQQLKGKGGVVEEFFFPAVAIPPCKGCFSCFFKGEHTCPHSGELAPIVKALDRADLIVLSSPNYVMGMTGQLKAVMDHLAYRWVSHRPRGEMFRKIGLCVSTTAGMGAKKVTGDLKTQLQYWGVPRVFSLPCVVNGYSWDTVPPGKKEKILRQSDRIVHKIKGARARGKTPLRAKGLFALMRKMQQDQDWNLLDRDHWEQEGWLQKVRPWRNVAERAKRGANE